MKTKSFGSTKQNHLISKSIFNYEIDYTIMYPSLTQYYSYVECLIWSLDERLTMFGRINLANTEGCDFLKLTRWSHFDLTNCFFSVGLKCKSWCFWTLPWEYTSQPINIRGAQLIEASYWLPNTTFMLFAFLHFSFTHFYPKTHQT